MFTGIKNIFRKSKTTKNETDKDRVETPTQDSNHLAQPDRSFLPEEKLQYVDTMGAGGNEKKTTADNAVKIVPISNWGFRSNHVMILCLDSRNRIIEIRRLCSNLAEAAQLCVDNNWDSEQLDSLPPTMPPILPPGRNLGIRPIRSLLDDVVYGIYTLNVGMEIDEIVTVRQTLQRAKDYCTMQGLTYQEFEMEVPQEPVIPENRPLGIRTLSQTQPNGDAYLVYQVYILNDDNSINRLLGVRQSLQTAKDFCISKNRNWMEI